MFSIILYLSLGCGESEKEDTIPELPSEPSDEDAPCDQSVDADCDGVNDEDDCDPNDGLVYPGATEIPYDGKDNDCAGDGDLNDVDGDGYIGESAGGDDCNDNNATVHPGAVEICYDGLDQDCQGGVEAENNNDCDGDGFIGRGTEATDCDDEDPTVNPDAEEIWYDGIDQDCDFHDDYDADFDNDPAVDYGGGDCDDNDPLSNSLGAEIWDGVDRNCDGEVDKLNIFDAYKSYFATALSDDGYLGSSMAPLSDYDQDGVIDIAIGSPFGLVDDQTGGAQGKVYILSLGTSDGLPSDMAYATISGGVNGYLGYDLTSPGDLDGDGFAELVAGSPSYDKALVFSGATLSAGGEISGSDAMTSLLGSTLAGIDVHSVGDVNGDAVPDVAVGTGGYFEATAGFAVWSGAAIAQGGTLGLSDALAAFSGSGRGGEVAGGFDLSGDGLSDVAAAFNTDSTPKVGIITGDDISGGVNLDIADFPLITGISGTGFGLEMGVANDIDGDGYAEILIAAPSTDVVAGSEGRVYIIDGDVALLGGSASGISMIVINGSEECGALSVMDKSADFDADGVPDILVSQLNNDSFNCGLSIYPRAHVFLGADLEEGTYSSSEGSAYFLSRDYADGMGSDAFGIDLEGDGDDDLVIGSPLYSDNLGYALVFLSYLGDE
nr:MopE-related protein [Myxococcota bacterium]